MYPLGLCQSGTFRSVFRYENPQVYMTAEQINVKRASAAVQHYTALHQHSSLLYCHYGFTQCYLPPDTSELAPL